MIMNKKCLYPAVLSIILLSTSILKAQHLPTEAEVEKAKIDCAFLTVEIKPKLKAALNLVKPNTFNAQLYEETHESVVDYDMQLTSYKNAQGEVLKTEIRTMLITASEEETVAHSHILCTNYYFPNGKILVEIITYRDSGNHDNSDMGWMFFDEKGNIIKKVINGREELKEKDIIYDIKAYEGAVTFKDY